MVYNWNESATNSPVADRMPSGKHVDVRIVRIVFGTKDGRPFLSNNGDPQIMIVFANRLDQEAAQMYTLSEKAGWTLAKLLSSCKPPADLDKMSQHNIEPKHFANPDFANKQLIGRIVDIDVSYRTQNGNEYANVNPVKPAPATTGDGEVIPPQDIPF